MKYLIIAIVLPIVVYLANKQNAKFVSNFEGLDDIQVLEAKKKWAYEFWKVRTKHFMITFGLFFSGIIMIEILPILAIALLLGSFVYFFIVIGLKSARYNLLMKDFDYEGLSKSDIVDTFKEWKSSGK